MTSGLDDFTRRLWSAVSVRCSDRTLHVFALSTLEPPVTSSSGRRRSTEQMTWFFIHRRNGNRGIGTLQGDGNNTMREGTEKPFPTSQGRSPKLCTVGAPPATCHGRKDGTWKHEMINGLAMKRKGNRLPLVHFVSQSHRSHRAAWHIASHRGCVRAWLGGQRAGRAHNF